MSTSSEVAIAVVAAVEEGAFADAALRAELAGSGLSGAAAARATALAFGTIRLQRRCDFVLRGLLRQRLPALEPLLRAVLRVGAFELLWAETANAPATVHSLVEVAKRRGHAGLAGITNGVLRNLLRQAEALREPPAELRRPEAVDDYLVYWESHPRWLVRRWLDRYGAAEATELCRLGNREPRVSLRANRLRCPPEELRQRLQTARIEAEPGRLAPECLHLPAAGAVETLPGYAEGCFTIQDEGAMLIAPVCGAQPGEQVVDLCAAPGGKTTHLGELMNNDGGILACDRNEARLKLVARTADRLGLSLISCRPGDSRGLEAAVPAADVVLLDAPCTGSGTLARRPDLRWRLNAERLAELLPLQRELLQTAAALTRPGGVLVYATCSLEPEENEQQMAWFDGNYAEFGPEAPPSAVPPGWDSARAWATIRPEADHDGFFVARRRRKS